MAVVAHLRATDLKEIHWIGGASHVDLYDKKQYVDLDVGKLTDFFTHSLAAR